MGSIILEPDSLYVTTTQLSEAKFHWAICRTDSHCNATRHHWHEQPNNQHVAEGYGFQKIQPKSLTGRVVLGYFKISAYTAPSSAVFEEICESTFETSYPTVRLNRIHGLTCRTWVFEVLTTLCERGFMEYRGTIRNYLESLERIITEKSRLADNAYLTNFFTKRVLTYVSMVVVI